ncbi:SDR family oxidoreductase [Alteribacillus iranensis]|uniref:NAD(P)-dependent dehydrogenase, short-chain alcohol dehydrogenase family n=1 Tax=Alteribacillus iranensis TaxID=930128 RepID=A0A1I2F0Y1_9BACI|nr:SDR family oxidoreductase [Alteribacillus iranensis]SFE99012.1 NAD(P)-dependent dehydrogenase, short-chain alcohol dehydrogenase family [Alteribacillus iranensis]
MDLQIEDKVIVIMGGSSGIGFKAAELFLAEGAKVAICGRNQQRLDNAIEELQQSAGEDRVFGKACDVSKKSDIEAFINATGEYFSRIDVLVNNAGKSLMSHFFDITDEQWQEQINLKFYAIIHAVQAVYPFMKNRGEGRIININATLSKEPEPHMIATASTRAGLLNLTKGLSREFAADNILVNSISLGIIKTDQWERRRITQNPEEDPEVFYQNLAEKRKVPLGRVGLPEEVADTILFLSSQRASYITGANIEVSGGLSKVL